MRDGNWKTWVWRNGSGGKDLVGKQLDGRTDSSLGRELCGQAEAR